MRKLLNKHEMKRITLSNSVYDNEKDGVVQDDLSDKESDELSFNQEVTYYESRINQNYFLSRRII